jgi:hypothetical protein
MDLKELKQSKGYAACLMIARRADLTDRQKIKRVGSRYRGLMDQMIQIIREEKIPLVNGPAHPKGASVDPGKLHPITRDLSNTTGAMRPLSVDYSLGVGAKLWHCAKGGVSISLRNNGSDVFMLDPMTKQPRRFVSAAAALRALGTIIKGIKR